MLKNLIAKAGVKAAMNPIADDMKRVDVTSKIPEHWQRYSLIVTSLYLRMLEFWVPLPQYTASFLPGRKSFSFAYLLRMIQMTLDYPPVYKSNW